MKSESSKTTTMPHPTATMEHQKATGQTKKPLTAQQIFKYVNIVVVAVLMLCLRGFYDFRNHCIAKGYYVFASDSLIWCAIGFIGIFIIKYSYNYLMSRYIESIILPKYTGYTRVYKAGLVLKLSFDTMFYLTTTIFAYSQFWDYYWFPKMAGGCGSCSQMYTYYPNWPQTKRTQLEMYFMIQLGVHIFSVFEMLVIKRKIYRKFNEYLLHHFVAASLILFSMMSNQITAGSMVLIIHDASDIVVAFGRGYCETKFESKNRTVVTYVMMVLVWVYLRIFVFPYCLLSNVYVNKPSPQDYWYMISFEYHYLLVMALVLYAMHLFWTFFLLKIGLESFRGHQEMENIHENDKAND